MKPDICVGARVRLAGVPAWLIHDLPDDEQAEIVAHIGCVAVVSDIDSHGYFWLRFGSTTEDSDGANYTGHSFCVSQEFLEKVEQ
jgi:hypothetical protein